MIVKFLYPWCFVIIISFDTNPEKNNEVRAFVVGSHNEQHICVILARRYKAVKTVDLFDPLAVP